MTTVFEYTHRADVDSSLAETIYYNDKNYTLAIEFVDEWRSNKPSAFYSAVPKNIYDSLVASDSIGRTYNTLIKSQFQSLSNGTVYGVEYRAVDGVTQSKVIEDEKSADELSYQVYGYVRVSGQVNATDRKEAAEKFAGELIDEGYSLEEIAVTEVTITIE